MAPKASPSKAATPSKPSSPSKAATPKPGGRPRSGAAAKKDAASKPGTAAATGPSEELTKKLEELEQERRKEEAARNYLQLERDKIGGFWEVTRRELDDKRAELRVKDRDIEELQDKHAAELRVYKQKVKHLLYEHQGHISKLKADAEAALKQQQDVFARQESELADDKRRLKQHIKEQELSGVELLKQFRLENAKAASKLRQEFELQARQIQQKYEAQLKELQGALEARYTSELREVEESKNAHIQSLMQSHEKAFREMKAYYNEITGANLDLIKTLKEEIAEMKRTEVKQEKLMHDVARENKRLTEPLSKAVQEVEELRQAVAAAERDHAALGSAKTRLAVAERQCKALEWENEVVTQRLEAVERERDELRAQLEAAVLAVQQRASLRAMVLEKKLEALGAELERRDSHLASAMSANPLPASKRASMHSHYASVRSPSPRPVGTDPGAAGGQDASGAAETTDTGSSRGVAPAADTAGTARKVGGTAAAHLVWSKSGGDVDSLLATALSTPLPDMDQDILEDDAPAAILRELEAMQAKEAAAAAGTPLHTLTTASLEGKLAQAVAAAEGAAAEAMIPAVRSRAAVGDMP